MRICTLAVLGISSLLSVGWLGAAEKVADAKAEIKKLEGVYVMVSGQANGEKIPENVVKASTLTVEGDKHTVKVGDDTIIGTHKLVPTKMPKEIDSTDT